MSAKVLEARITKAHRGRVQPLLQLRRGAPLLALQPCQLRGLLLADRLGRLRCAQLVAQVLELAVRIRRGLQE